MTGKYAEMAHVIRNYEKVGFKYLGQSLVKSSARDLFFRASLCFLANEDLAGAKLAVEKYSMEDPSFETCD